MSLRLAGLIFTYIESKNNVINFQETNIKQKLNKNIMLTR